MSRSCSRRRIGTALAATAALLAPGLTVLTPAALAVSPDVVISEIYGGGGNSGATLTNDFIELQNLGSAPVDVTGWSVQYASATGVSWAVTPLAGTIAPGSRYLVQQAAGTGGTTSLPTPDATGNTAIAGGAGKVALVTNTTACTLTTCATNEGLRDLVGFGSTANFFEGNGAAPAPSSTNSTARTGADTDDNAADFRAGLPTPENRALSAPAFTTDCPSALATDVGVGTSAPVSATDPDAGVTSATLSSAPVVGVSLEGFTASAAGQPATATLTVAATTAAGSYPVDVTFTAGGRTVTCTVAVEVRAVQGVTLVSTVQGDGTASPLVGERVTVEAVVTSLITSNDRLNGFFVQEQDADADTNPATSEGVYVFCGSVCPTGLAGGDLVRVNGVVAEFNTSTQISVVDGSVTTVSSGQPLPSAATVALPAATPTTAAGTFENVEGMRTTVAGTLAVSEYFNLARFGEIVLTADERPYQYTQLNAPSVEGNAAYLADLATRRIILDDDSNDQNDATSGATDEPYYYPTPGLSTGNRFRGGDTVEGLTGVLEYSFGAWKLRPVSGADYTFTSTNPRPAAPDEVGGRLTVASFNVLNYFATVDTTTSTSSGPCGPSGTDDCRGADSEAERVRQLDKIVAALKGLDADVFGLIEIQNDAGAATQQIVEALNAATAPGTYDYIRTGFIGTDAIKQAFLYKPATVRPAGDFALLTSVQDPAFIDTRNRPSLIQTFDEVATGERFTVSVNHFKSKGSGCGTGDDSAADGSGNCDGTRTAAAEALLRYLATDPTGSGDPDVLLIGDLNSYSMERPISVLKAGGYVDLLDRFEGDESYGYLFDGQLGNLDHALANGSLDGQVTGAGGWKINADESPLLDYNDTVQDAGEAPFERVSSALPLYAPDAYRSSDHDPAIVGLSLGSPGNQPLRLTLLHNNDGESSLLPAAPRGGIARFGTLVNELRTEADAEGGVLLLSSGDNFLAGPQLQASLENYDGDTDYSDDGPFYDALAMDYLDYDASAVGNHEFDFGPNGLGYFLSQFEDSNIRFVSSNLDVTGDAALTQFVSPSPGEPGTLVEWTRTTADGRSIAIVGATTPRLPSISSPGPDVEAREDVRAAVQDAINEATADGTDVVVLIAHLQNIAEDQALVRELSGVDAVIAGGGDELLANPDDLLLPTTPASVPFGPYPLLATGADASSVPIVTTQGSYGYLGRLVLDIDADGKVTAIDPISGPVRNVFNATTPPADQRQPDAFLLANVEQPVAAFTAALAAEVVAQSDVVLDARTAINRNQETNLGSLFADALRITAEQGAPEFGATNPTVALQNSGGIRSDRTYGPGPISRLDSFQIAPFTNFVGYTIGLEPAKLKELLERSVSANTVTAADGTVSLQSEGRFGQWSGIELVYDPTQAAQTVVRNADGSVTITAAGERVRQVTLTNNTPDPADDIVVVRNGVVVDGAPSVDLAANSFTVGQNGDNYPFNLTEGQFVNLPVTYQESLENRLRELGTITAATYPEGGLGRIVVGGDVVIDPDPEPEPEPVRPGNSGNAPGQNKGPNGPGNSGNAPGQNKGPDGPGKSGQAPGQAKKTGRIA